MDTGVDNNEPDSSRREREALQDLTAAMADGEGSVEDRIGRVIDVGCAHLDYPSGFLSVVTGDEYEITVAAGEGAEESVGETAPLDETFCRRTLDADEIYAIPDVAETDPDDPAYDRWGLETYVGIPVEVEGQAYGTLCFGDDEAAREGLDEWQRTLLHNLRQWVESELEREQLSALRERNERLLEATFDSPNSFVGILDADGRVLRANRTALRFASVEESDVRGTPFHETPWWDHDEEYQRRCRDAIERAAEGETVEFEAIHESPNGERIRTAVTVRPVHEAGEVSEIIAEGLDITDLKNREEQIEFFNSILRHDILNGMNVIQARAETLETELEGEHREHVRTIADWSDDIIELTQKVRSVLSTLSPGGLADPEPVDLKSALESAARRPVGMDEECLISVDVPAVTVAADDLLDDVFANILLNAVEHAEESPQIEVTATESRETVTVRVADDGPGIAPERRREVFEQGAKRRGSGGTGFGLYFVDVMVDSYGGDVWIEESDMGGTAVVVELPLAG